LTEVFSEIKGGCSYEDNNAHHSYRYRKKKGRAAVNAMSLDGAEFGIARECVNEAEGSHRLTAVRLFGIFLLYKSDSCAHVQARQLLHWAGRREQT
jgi:hypothetical protein